jgi:hypothetical protein
MRKDMLILALLGLGCAGWSGTQTKTYRKKLEIPAEIQGYSCGTGYAWFYPGARLERCTVNRETAFGEANVPPGSIIVLHADGKPKFVYLSHDAPLVGCQCRGGSWLGPGEGDTTAFYPSGKLKQCWLAGDQEVQGIPCRDAGGFSAAVFHHGGGATIFYENGKLQSCPVSKDFLGIKRGERLVQGL